MYFPNTNISLCSIYMIRHEFKLGLDADNYINVVTISDDF